MSSNCPLPPVALRMGGAHFRDDADFIASGVLEVRRLEGLAGLTRESRLLDWGCGAGRLAVGIKNSLGRIADYHGVDVQPALVEWAQQELTDDWTRFTLVDSRNERYNPSGAPERVIPAQPGSVDIFYAYSVFSHMLDDETADYFPIISEILAPGGRAVVTAFVEDAVPACVENPPDYGPLMWNGRLHCVRYERSYFEGLFAKAGLAIESFEYGNETDGQSLYVLRHGA